ncbi:MAG: hypothetical protein EBT92_00570 [Planctomycetes bacterium]|nr:hypothetical protein [Planctomycetota bacterium]NBY02707.1 hypothetical protein [Planctomycetota bacterium]
MGFQKSIYKFLIPLTGMLFTAIGCQIYYPYEPFIRTLQPDFANLTSESSSNSKCKVAVFFIEDFDFCDCGGFRELNAQVRASGFNNTYFGYLYHAHQFAKEIQSLSQKDPEMRFVVVGHGLGGTAAYWLAGKVNPIPVDLLVTLNCHENLWGTKHPNIVENLHLPAGDKPKNDMFKPLLGKVGDEEKSLDGHMIISQIAAIAKEIEVTQKGKEPKRDEWDFLKPKEDAGKKKSGQPAPPRIIQNSI